jgi:hypothetical protein
MFCVIHAPVVRAAREAHSVDPTDVEEQPLCQR